MYMIRPMDILAHMGGCLDNLPISTSSDPPAFPFSSRACGEEAAPLQPSESLYWSQSREPSVLVPFSRWDIYVSSKYGIAMMVSRDAVGICGASWNELGHDRYTMRERDPTRPPTSGPAASRTLKLIFILCNVRRNVGGRQTRRRFIAVVHHFIYFSFFFHKHTRILSIVQPSLIILQFFSCFVIFILFFITKSGLNCLTQKWIRIPGDFTCGRVYGIRYWFFGRLKLRYISRST